MTNRGNSKNSFCLQQIQKVDAGIPVASVHELLGSYSLDKKLIFCLQLTATNYIALVRFVSLRAQKKKKNNGPRLVASKRVDTITEALFWRFFWKSTTKVFFYLGLASYA